MFPRFIKRFGSAPGMRFGKLAGPARRAARFLPPAVASGAVVAAFGVSYASNYASCAFWDSKSKNAAKPSNASNAQQIDAQTGLPIEHAKLTFAPEVPPPITRNTPAVVHVTMTSDVFTAPLTNKYKYKFWGFNDHSPGPFIRARVGDTLDLTHINNDGSGMAHNIDFHAVSGPGGGASVTLAESNDSKHARFKLLHPGLYVYHCAAAPVPMHIANGMYGLILVEPEQGMPGPKPDKEYYVMQSEFYFDAPDSDSDTPDVAEYSYINGLKEQPDAVVFNGREGSLTQEQMLLSKVGERVRIYFGNGGPNLTSSFHVIGTIFDQVFNQGDLVSPPARSIQTTLVPPGGSAVVDVVPATKGNYTLVDHAIFRMDKGCVGFLAAQGPENKDVYYSERGLEPCPGCRLHP